MRLAEVIGIRVTEDEKKVLQKEADRFQITLSAYLRLKLVTAKAPIHGHVVFMDWEKYRALGSIKYDLRKIGVNINQLAHNANLSIQLGSVMNLELNKLEDLSQKIDQLFGITIELQKEIKDLTSERPRK